jgi:hypothetical protein
MRKGHLQTVSRTQYYCLKAQDGGANTRTPELQALLVSRAQADAPIASSSASGKSRTSIVYNVDMLINVIIYQESSHALSKVVMWI